MIKIKDILTKFYVKKRAMYAVTVGDYIGQFIVFTSSKPINGSYDVIFLPELERKILGASIIEEGLTKGILDYVKRLPSDVYHEIIKQLDYKANNKLADIQEAYNEYNNRREQFTTPDILGESE